MTDSLLIAFIFLAAGIIAVPIATRLGLGSVLGYLIAGIVISPLLAILGVDIISIQHFAEFGVVMMLFLIGLELEPRKLWDMRAQLLGLGGGQVTLCALAITAVTIASGYPWQISLATGLVLCLSSTAIVLQTLNEKGLMKSEGGQASFSVLLTQDVAVIPMLALMPLLAMPEIAGLAAEAAHTAETGGDHGGASLSLVDDLPGWLAALVTLGAITAVVGIGNYMTAPLFRFIGRAQLRELFIATALTIVIGIALLMSLVGLSPALGTFLAGVVLANSEYRHELEADIDPFRGLLLGVFFMSIGAGIDFYLMANDWGTVLGLALGLIAIKTTMHLILSYLFGIRGAARWLFSLSLAQAGEFGFVLLSFAAANQVMPRDYADLLLLVVALSMLITPLLFILYDRVISPRFLHQENRDADSIEEQSETIIVGHGRIGGIVNQILRGAGHNTTVIDYSSAQLDMLRAFGVKVFFGDGTQPDLLKAAGIAKAKLLVIAIDNRPGAVELVRYVRQNYPHVHVIAMAYGRMQVYNLFAAGCRDIIRETFDSSVRAGRSALEALGYSHETAQHMVDGFVDDDRAILIAMAPLHDPDIPAHENEAYVAETLRIRALQEDVRQEHGVAFGKLSQRLADLESE